MTIFLVFFVGFFFVWRYLASDFLIGLWPSFLFCDARAAFLFCAFSFFCSSFTGTARMPMGECYRAVFRNSRAHRRLGPGRLPRWQGGCVGGRMRPAKSELGGYTVSGFTTLPEFSTRVPPKSSASATATKRRQNLLLQRIAALAEHRTSYPVPLDKVDKWLKMNGEEFVTTGDWDSDATAYDMTTLKEKGYITCFDPTAKPGVFLGSKPIASPIVTKQAQTPTQPVTIWITHQGLEIVEEFEKPWWKKMYEVQPGTSAQVIIAVATILWTIGIGVYVQFHVAGVQKQSKQPAATVPATLTPLRHQQPVL
jgi:hypothetical protein